MGRFSDDTAVRRTAPGRYAARIDPGWWIRRGPNGGYLAAIVLRAILAEVDDTARSPRSFTLHYLRPPEEGAAELEVDVLRSGRSLSTVAARLTQGGVRCIEALAAVATARPGLAFDDTEAPAVAGPADLDPPPAAPGEITMRARYEYRHGIGGLSGSGAAGALTGGWIRPTGDEPVDEVLVAALTDGWVPALFTKLTGPVAAPTVDLTVHFRQAPPRRPGWCLVRFRSVLAAEGYVEEDGEVWSDDGRLLAQSRQLAVLLGPG